MTYDPNIPVGTNLISNDRPKILANFTALNQIFGSNPTADHYQWDAVTNAGLHKQVTLPVVRSADPVLSGANTGMYYSKLVSGVAQPFFAGWNGTTTAVTQLGGSGSSPVLIPGANGYVTFPGGFIMQWGVIPSYSGGAVVVNFGTAPNIVFPTSCFNCQISYGAGNISTITSFSGLSQAGFTLRATNPIVGGPIQVYWFAVGN